MSMAEVKAQLNPVHTHEPDLEPDELPSDKELRDSVSKAAAEKEDQTDEKAAKRRADDPRSQREYTFPINHVSGTGKVHTGEFTTKILSIHERQRAGILRAQLGGGLPVESLDALTVELNLMISHLTFSLTDRPSWAESLRNLDDFAVVQAIYTEVASHEAYFLGWSED